MTPCMCVRMLVVLLLSPGVHLAACHEACHVWEEFAVWENDQELQLANGVIHTGLDPDGVVRRTYAGSSPRAAPWCSAEDLT